MWSDAEIAEIAAELGIKATHAPKKSEAYWIWREKVAAARMSAERFGPAHKQTMLAIEEANLSVRPAQRDFDEEKHDDRS